MTVVQKYRNHIFYTNNSGEIWTGQGIRPQEFSEKWDSLLEFAVHKQLLKVVNSNLWTIQRQVPITLKLTPQFKPVKWVFDFVLTHPNLNSIYLEVKGGYLKKSRTEARALTHKLILFQAFSREIFDHTYILSESTFAIPGTRLATISYKEFTL